MTRIRQVVAVSAFCLAIGAAPPARHGVEAQPQGSARRSGESCGSGGRSHLTLRCGRAGSGARRVFRTRGDRGDALAHRARSALPKSEGAAHRRTLLMHVAGECGDQPLCERGQRPTDGRRSGRAAARQSGLRAVPPSDARPRAARAGPGEPLLRAHFPDRG